MSVDSNIDKSIRVVNNAIDLLGDALTQEDLKKIAEDAIAEIKSNLQNEGHVVTGNLLSDVGITEEKSGSISIGSKEEYALYLEYGRGPVEPVKAKVLHFTAKDGTEVFTKRVGPTQPTGVFERSILASVPKSVEEIAKKKNQELSK